MKLKIKYLVIPTQLFVILVFYGGMLMNYYYLGPILYEGETYRMKMEITDFCEGFCSKKGCDARDEVQMNKAMEHYGELYNGEGDFYIMDSNADIIYSTGGKKGYGYDVLGELYGNRAVDLLRIEYNSRDEKCSMAYDRRKWTSMYALSVPEDNLFFFYSIDYKIAGSRLYHSLKLLVSFMIFGGLLVIAVAFFMGRRVSGQMKFELETTKELETAAEIQRSMLPRGDRQLLQLDVNARLIPARKVAGDFYSYYTNNGYFYFCIGDVSGKGVPASLFMSRAVTLFRVCAKAGIKPAEIASYINDELCLYNDKNLFLTCIVGRVRASDGLVTYVNAGHEIPVVWDGSQESHLEFLESEGNIPFGVVPDTVFIEETYQIEKNGLVFMYTDGVSEARSRSRTLFGRDTLLNLLEPYKELSAKGFNDVLLDDISNFESNTRQSDDITVLTFRNVPIKKHLVIKNEIKELRNLAGFTEDIFRECVFDEKERVLVRSGLDEAVTNCVMYAYDSPGNEIDVAAYIEDEQLCFIVKDSGKPFNPLEYVPKPSEELQIGGMGIPMMKAAYSDMQYKREGGYNILKLIKKL